MTQSESDAIMLIQDLDLSPMKIILDEMEFNHDIEFAVLDTLNDVYNRITDIQKKVTKQVPVLLKKDKT